MASAVNELMEQRRVVVRRIHKAVAGRHVHSVGTWAVESTPFVLVVEKERRAVPPAADDALA